MEAFREVHVDVVPVEGKGRAALSQAACDARALVLKDVPVAMCPIPSTARHVLTCARCLRYVGSLHDQLRSLCGAASSADAAADAAGVGGHAVDVPAALPLLADGSDHLSDLVRCPGGCGAVYCSTACAEEDAPAHAVLCPRGRDPASPWAVFYSHAAKTCETFLLGASLAAAAVAGALRGDTTVFEEYSVTAPWWALVPLPDGVPDEEVVDFQASMRATAKRSWKRLMAAFAAHEDSAVHAAAKSVCTLDAFGRFCGLATQNGVSVSLSNPVASYLEAVVASGAVPPELRPVCSCIVALPPPDAADGGAVDDGFDDADSEDSASEDSDDEDEEDESEDDDDGCSAAWEGVDVAGLSDEDVLQLAAARVPHIEASAVFPVLSTLNHSCDPNAAVVFLQDATAMVSTTRSVGAGEELCISYVDPSLPFEERQRELFEYKFVCGCSRCGGRK